ncbi:hypothetical protein SAMN02745824_2021 [Parasphingorhabdus marina DSM 22363]|uniref:Cytochrome c domain-containing protein n=1 Tax=Parasphingorhabdus marina DSM 22363 TaxID=1123272 RepID=A0A1N6EP48_9SPHN|nr:hypothetical protein [Parasphingorhabdus marina]SIN84785.1 hypothetical protein SAMN02745824_2021 [Parasphingorhabdus marina DSM 22363]
MDRQRQNLLIAIVATLCGVAAAQAADKPAFRALSWIAPGQEFEALSSEPIGSLRLSAVLADKSQDIAIGRALFETPTLLGGQAAKAGLSCGSCHTNGRDNPHFQFPGVSGAPGTADVTHSFFSSKRGDGTFNPVRIPDLAKPGKVSRLAELPDLETFVRALIVEEFDGEEPSDAVLAALSSYIRALCDGCDKTKRPVTVQNPLGRIEQALMLVEQGKARLADDVLHLLLASARHQLGLIHERYVAPDLSRQRKALKKLSLDLMLVQRSLANEQRDNRLPIGEVIEDFSTLRDELIRLESQSLYNPEKLARAIK